MSQNEEEYHINDQVIITKRDDPMYAFMGYIIKIPKGKSLCFHVTFKRHTQIHFFVHRVYRKEDFKLLYPREDSNHGT